MKVKPIIATLLGLAIAYAAYWYAIAYYAEGYLATRLERLQKSGVTLLYDSFATVGFPYRLQLRLGNARVEIQQGPYRLAAMTDELEIDVKPWQWNNANLIAKDLGIELQSSWAAWMNFRAQAASLQAGYTGNDGESLHLQLELHELDFPSSGMHIKSASIDSRRLGLSITPATNELYEPDQARFSFDFDGIYLPGTAVSSGNGYLDEVASTIEIHGDSLPGLDVKDVENWRDGGGTVELTNFSFRSGESVIVGEGSFSLDDQLRLIGASSLIVSKVKHFREALGAIGTDWSVSLLRSLDAEKLDDDQQVLSIMFANGTAMSGAQVLHRYGGIIRPN